MSTVSTIGSTTTGNHRTFPVMSFNPLVPAFLPHYHFPSDPPISLCNPAAKNLPLAQVFCGMPPSITPFHAPPITQPVVDGAFILPPFRPKKPSKQDDEIVQPLPESSSLLLLSLQHQEQCLEVIHKTIQQIHQHLKAEPLNKRTLQMIFFQLQNDFAFLRYLLFSSVGTIPVNDTSVNNSAFSPPTNHNLNLNPTFLHSRSSALMNNQIVVLPGRALWDHPEEN